MVRQGCRALAMATALLPMKVPTSAIRVLTQLERGEHPDVRKSFQSAASEPSPPKQETPPKPEAKPEKKQAMSAGGGGMGGGMPGMGMM